MHHVHAVEANQIPVAVGTVIDTSTHSCGLCNEPIAGFDVCYFITTLFIHTLTLFIWNSLQIIATNCGHLFHQDCLALSSSSSSTPTCPTCHSTLSPSIISLLTVSTMPLNPTSSGIHTGRDHTPPPTRVEPIYCRGCGRLFTPRSESRNQAGYYRCENCVGVEATVWSICPFT